MKKSWIPLVVFMVAFVPRGLAQDAEITRATLVGLNGVAVNVGVDPDAERVGLRQSTFRTDVEVKLRQAGIRVLTNTEVSDTPGAPVLQLNVHTLESKSGFYPFHIELKLWQVARLVRDPSIVSAAITWNVSGGGIAGSERLSFIRDVVRDKVDQFINAYLAANPKR